MQRNSADQSAAKETMLTGDNALISRTHTGARAKQNAPSMVNSTPLILSDRMAATAFSPA